MNVADNTRICRQILVKFFFDGWDDVSLATCPSLSMLSCVTIKVKNGIKF